MRISRNWNFHGDMLRHNSNGTRWGCPQMWGYPEMFNRTMTFRGILLTSTKMFHGLQQVIDFGLATPYKGRVKEFAGTVSCQQLPFLLAEWNATGRLALSLYVIIVIIIRFWPTFFIDEKKCCHLVARSGQVFGPRAGNCAGWGVHSCGQQCETKWLAYLVIFHHISTISIHFPTGLWVQESLSLYKSRFLTCKKRPAESGFSMAADIWAVGVTAFELLAGAAQLLRDGVS